MDEATAIETALEKAQPGDLVVIFPADVQRTLQIIGCFQDKLNPKPSYHSSSYSIGPDFVPYPRSSKPLEIDGIPAAGSPE
ncbi:MAG: hypothetical protein ACUVRV_10195 [Cyanobacteriota bacterium]